MTARYLAVIGPGDANGDQRILARRTGELVAEAGAILISGGRGGAMSASCQGAAERGGITVGLLPGRDRAAGNPHLTVTLPTGLGELRNGLVVGTADAVIAIAGGWGTLSEIALAMRTGKPVVLLGDWPVVPSGGSATRMMSADTAEQAVSMAIAACASGS